MRTAWMSVLLMAASTEAQVVWQPIEVQQPPVARSQTAMAYDSARRRVVLFGGDGFVGGVSPANDTWEWDGVSWQQITIAGAVPPRSAGHAMAYDEAREETVLFGGVAQPRDTWVWDGSTWSLRAQNGPPARWSHTMAYDGARQRVVMFGGRILGGGLLDDMWEWDGATWAPVTVQPTVVSVDAAADTVADQGQPATNFGSVTPLPVGRVNGIPTRAYLRFDLASVAGMGSPTSVTLRLFHSENSPAGGCSNKDLFAVSALWSESTLTWNSQPPSDPVVQANTCPEAGFAGWKTFDVTLLVQEWLDGRRPNRGLMIRDQFETVGAWRPLKIVSREGVASQRPQLQFTFDGAPAPQAEHAMAYDRARQRLVLVEPSTQTWEWDGSSWSRLTRIGLPPRQEAALAYDEFRQRIVLYGGAASFAALPSGDTWEWDGEVWRSLPKGSAREDHAMVYDAARRQILAFGGKDLFGLRLNDTWALRLSDRRVIDVGPGGLGGPVTPTLSPVGSPVVGNTDFALQVGAVPAGAMTFLALSAHARRDNASGALSPAPPVDLRWAVANGGGIAHFPLAIPPVASLSGVTFFARGVALHPGGSLSGVASATPGRKVTIED